MAAPERPIPQKGEVPVRELHVGQVFRPFEGLTSFPQRDISYEDPVELLGVAIDFVGVRGELIVMTTPPLQVQEYVSTETPLGSVRSVQITTGNMHTVAETPLELELSFPRTTIDEYMRLRPYIMEFNLGEKRYYLRCGGVDYEKSVAGSLKDEGGMELFDSILKPMEGEDENIVLLPYDTNKLAGIEARIVEKETSERDLL